MDDKVLNNLIEHAATMDMHMKHDVTGQITKEELDMINFDEKNMSPIMFNHIRDRDILIVAWKIGQMELRPLQGRKNAFE